MKKKSFTLRISPELYKSIMGYSARSRAGVSDICRSALLVYLAAPPDLSPSFKSGGVEIGVWLTSQERRQMRDRANRVKRLIRKQVSSATIMRSAILAFIADDLQAKKMHKRNPSAPGGAVGAHTKKISGGNG